MGSAGSDYVLWQALVNLRLPFAIKSVYPKDYDQESDPDDLLYIGESFEGIPSDAVIGGDDETMSDVLRGRLNAHVEKDVIWAVKPLKYVQASTYGTYGNEPSTATSYVAGALFVKFPPAGEGIRSPVGAS